MTRPWSPRGVVVAAAGVAVAALLAPSSPRGAPSPLRVMPLGDSITDGFNALRDLHVTRIFIDPAIDPESGDVHGQILRLGEIN